MIRYLFLFLLLLPSSFSVAAFRHNRPRQPSSGSADSAMLNRILQVEDRRTAKDKALIAALSSPSRRVVKAALLALGRIRDASALDSISNVLNRKDREYKRFAAFALGLIGSETALKIVQQHLQMQGDPEVIASLLHAMGRAGNEQNLSAVAAFLKEGGPPEVIEAACHGLGILWSGPSEKWAVPSDALTRLVKLAGGAEPVARAAAFALSRYKGDATALPSMPLVDAATKAQWPETRALLCRTLSRVHTLESTLFLSSQLSAVVAPISVRIEAAKSLSSHPASETTLAALKKGIEDPNSQLVYQALESAFNLGGSASQKLSDSIDSLYRTSASIWLKGAAMKTLSGVNPTLARQRVNEVLAATASPLTEAAVSSLGILGSAEDCERVSSFIGAPGVRIAEAALEALSQTPEDRVPASARPAVRKVLERGDTALTSLAAQLIEKFKWRELAGSLATVYRLLTEPDQIEAKIAVLNALGAVGDHSHLEVIESAMNDPERLVITAAVNAKKAISGKDESHKIPLNSKITGPFPTNYSDARASTQHKIVLQTNRGEVVIKLMEEAPLTSFQITRLVKQGFYNGKTFHRVVPNFVTQGGDPHGDGYGGPGFLIRDEVSLLAHERGTVGIATAGPDTGGCQFFFNLSPNLHLDGKYTVFGEVASGMEIVDKLEVGDRILTAKIR